VLDEAGNPHQVMARTLWRAGVGKNSCWLGWRFIRIQIKGDGGLTPPLAPTKIFRRLHHQAKRNAMKYRLLASSTAAALLTAASSGAFAASLFSNDFETNANFFSGSGTAVGTQGYSGFGFGTTFLRNDSSPAALSTLTFSAAAGATDATVSLSLAIIDSWDSSASFGPDAFNVTLNGNLLFTVVFDNYLNLGASVTPGLVSLSYGSALGFNNDFRDAAYTLTLSLGNLAAGNHTIGFFASGPGWQGGGDESWAVDNVQVIGTPVPEPTTSVLLLAGIAALAIRARRRAR